MECVPCAPSVAVVGGTHGNEMAGVLLVKRMQAAPEAFQREGIRTIPVIGANNCC